eukprot:snap_masked-scaffold_31-processed-gene-1.43-mRNA-1 protein AED:1.00 eAED:1.00 QI:0/0/0/0/1/1/2/0/85
MTDSSLQLQRKTKFKLRDLETAQPLEFTNPFCQREFIHCGKVLDITTRESYNLYDASKQLRALKTKTRSNGLRTMGDSQEILVCK